jgi:hypothetical protein
VNLMPAAGFNSVCLRMECTPWHTYNAIVTGRHYYC